VTTLYCSYYTHTSVHSHFTAHCLVAAPNGGRFPSCGFPNCLQPQLPLLTATAQRLNPSTSLTAKSANGQSACLSWCQARIWGPRPDFYYCQTVAGLLMWGALSNESTGLLSTIAAGPRQRSHYRVRLPRGLGLMTVFYCLRFETPPTWRARPPYLYPPGTDWPSYIPRHWVHFLSPHTTPRATVEIFESASTRGTNCSC
jgi:hypothetical protein